MSGALLIGPAQLDTLRALRAYAEGNPRADPIAAGPPGAIPGHVAEIPVGYRVVLSLDRLPSRTGAVPPRWFRVASFSTAAPGRVPGPHAVAELVPHLGFTAPLEDLMIDLEDLPGGGTAVLVHEPVDGPEGPEAA